MGAYGNYSNSWSKKKSFKIILHLKFAFMFESSNRLKVFSGQNVKMGGKPASNEIYI